MRSNFDKGQVLLTMVKGEPGNTSVGIGWGYPFHWQSKMLIPAGTPNGIVTTAAAEVLAPPVFRR
jgi:hypothetical protein